MVREFGQFSPVDVAESDASRQRGRRVQTSSRIDSLLTDGYRTPIDDNGHSEEFPDGFYEDMSAGISDPQDTLGDVFHLDRFIK